jgi:hypothetical protein
MWDWVFRKGMIHKQVPGDWELKKYFSEIIRTFEGKQVYRFENVNVYIDKNLLFIFENSQWMTRRLNDLVSKTIFNLHAQHHFLPHYSVMMFGFFLLMNIRSVITKKRSN